MTVQLGARFKVYYLDSAMLMDNQDVQLISSSGNMFGINRVVLACASQLFYHVLSDLYSCPIANRKA